MIDPTDPARDLGEQPLAALMDRLGLETSALVAASTDGLTFKQVSRARRGRRLTANTMGKVERAVAAAAKRPVERSELFSYEPLP